MSTHTTELLTAAMAAILIKCPALGPSQFQSHMLCHVSHSQGLLRSNSINLNSSEKSRTEKENLPWP